MDEYENITLALRIALSALEAIENDFSMDEDYIREYAKEILDQIETLNHVEKEMIKH